MGGIGRRLNGVANRHIVSHVSIPNARVGWGCGVAIGYGYGAGLFLKPTALTSLSTAIKQRLPPELVARFSSSSGGSSSSHASHTNDIGGGVVAPPPTTSPPPPATLLPQQSKTSDSSSSSLESDLADLMKLVQKQQVALYSLQEEVAALRHAISSKKKS